MLFAETAQGGTLAWNSFNVEYGWKNIMVTADDKAIYNEDNKVVPAGYYAFQIVEEDGTLADDIYYGEGDLQFGRVYDALFSMEKDEDLVEMLDAVVYEGETVKNEGEVDGVLTDNIAAFLKDYTVVPKYNTKAMINAGKLNQEIIVVTDGDNIPFHDGTYSANQLYVLDWATGNILVKVFDTADVNANGKKDEFHYEVEWYYNAQFDVFFRIGLTAQGEYLYTDDGELIYVAGDDKISTFDPEDLDIVGVYGVEIMEQEDVDAMKAAILEASKNYKYFDIYTKFNAASDIATAAYADLEWFDLDGDDKADYAEYQSYHFARYNGMGAVNCGTANTGKCAQQYNFSDKSYLAEGTCAHTLTGTGRYTESYTLTGLTEGFTGWVIYGVNEVTNEITIIKEIASKATTTEADTYVATGVVRNWSIAGKYIVIDNEKIPFDYATLGGTDVQFVNVAKNADTKASYTNTIDNYFNQFVEYVVVDGKLVNIDAKGDTTAEFIVVEKFVGIDSNNKIVVGGYKVNATGEIVYDTFAIETINGWDNGDYFFYGDPARVEEEQAFSKGAVYQITSYDADNELYFVEVLGYYDEENYWEPCPECYEWDAEEEDWVEKDLTTACTCDCHSENEHNGEHLIKYLFETVDASHLGKVATIAIDDGYRTVDYGGTKATKKLTDKDVYVIVGDPNASQYAYLGNYMPIYVFTGKAQDGWAVAGQMIVGNQNSNAFIIVNPVLIEGFNYDTYKTQFVVATKKVITDKSYNGVSGFGKDYYVYGATEYTYEVFDLLTGANTTVKTTNMELDLGEVYVAIDGYVFGDNNNTMADFTGNVGKAYEGLAFDAYHDTEWRENADFKFTWINFTKAYCQNAKDAAKNFSLNYVSNGAGILDFKNDHDDLVDSYKVYAVDLDEELELVEDIYTLNEKDFDKLGDVKSIPAFVVYDVDKEAAVVYVMIDMAALNNVTDEDGENFFVEELVEVEEDAAYVDGSANITLTTNPNDDDAIVSAKLNSVTFNFTGEGTDGMHNIIHTNAWFFGDKGTCDKQGETEVTVQIGDAVTTDTIFTDVASLTYDEVSECEFYDEEETICRMIKAITVDLGGIALDVEDRNYVKVELNNDWALTLKITFVDDEPVVEFYVAKTKNGNMNVYIDGAFVADGNNTFVARADANI